jgi:hypothetical protein
MFITENTQVVISDVTSAVGAPSWNSLKRGIALGPDRF